MLQKGGYSFSLTLTKDKAFLLSKNNFIALSISSVVLNGDVV